MAGAVKAVGAQASSDAKSVKTVSKDDAKKVADAANRPVGPNLAGTSGATAERVGPHVQQVVAKVIKTIDDGKSTGNVTASAKRPAVEQKLQTVAQQATAKDGQAGHGDRVGHDEGRTRTAFQRDAVGEANRGQAPANVVNGLFSVKPAAAETRSVENNAPKESAGKDQSENGDGGNKNVDGTAWIKDGWNWFVTGTGENIKRTLETFRDAPKNIFDAIVEGGGGILVNVGKFFGQVKDHIVDRFVSPGSDFKQIDGLTPVGDGVYSRKPLAPKADHLPAGFDGFGGVKDNGLVREFFQIPSSSDRGYVEHLVKEGDAVKKGQPIYREINPELEAAKTAAETQLRQIRTQIGVAIEQAPIEIAALDRQIDSAKSQILEQDSKINRVVGQLASWKPATAAGAISRDQYGALENQLSTLRQGSDQLKDELTRLQANRKLAGDLRGLTPDGVIEAARRGDKARLATLPPTISRLADDYLGATRELASVNRRREERVGRAPFDGRAVNQRNVRFSFAGEDTRTTNTRPVDRDGNVGTIGIVPLETARATVSAVRVPHDIARTVNVGDKVTLALPSGLGEGTVSAKNYLGPNVGYEIQVSDPKIGDKSLNVGDLRAPFRVVLERLGDLRSRGMVHEADGEPPRIRRLFAGSSDSVVLGPPTPPSFQIDRAPVAQQRAFIEVPVAIPTSRDGIVKQVGKISIEATVNTDGRTATFVGTPAAVYTPSQTGTAGAVTAQVVPVNTGSSQKGSPVPESGLIVQVRGSIQPSRRTVGGSGSATDKTATGTVTVSEAPAQNPSIFNIHIVPSGDISGKGPAIRVVAPDLYVTGSAEQTR